MNGLNSVFPWQAESWASLQGLIEQQRLPHGLMLMGPAEIGKQHFALALGQRLLCSSPQNSMACGHCKQCQLMMAGTHPDFLLLEPEEPGKAIKIDDIRPLADFSGKTAAQGGWRIIIVTPAEAMNINASNAFLKTLEEPGANILIVLITHQAGAVLPTVRSRCRILQFPVPELMASRQWLLTSTKSSESDINTALVRASGKPLRAKRFLETDLLSRFEQFEDLINSVERGDILPLVAAKQMNMLPDIELIEGLQRHVYDQLKSSVSAKATQVEPGFRFLDKLAQVKQRVMSTSNPNMQLLWEEVLMDFKTMLNFVR